MRSLALIALSAAALSAQSAGEIRGYAWDAEGRPMPQAKISLTAETPNRTARLQPPRMAPSTRAVFSPAITNLPPATSKRQLATESGTALDLKPGEIAHADLTLGRSTVHYGFWKRLGRRFVGLH